MVQKSAAEKQYKSFENTPGQQSKLDRKQQKKNKNKEAPLFSTQLDTADIQEFTQK